ncbi:MAG: NADH kinase pos5 [Trizodia sp. TS-e1964]|nr:MAG: NADH kinase pos5 [Trizodia sp. TS-e1964]
MLFRIVFNNNSYKTPSSDLLSLRWPEPPRNILLVKKKNVKTVTESLLEFAQHIQTTYPSSCLILEPRAAAELHHALPFPIYSASAEEFPSQLPQKVDMCATLGGDGTILHASSLFASTPSVPPILSFSMGTLGFLGEWKFHEYKRAFREVYMSGRGTASHHHHPTSYPATPSGEGATGWSSIRGKSMGLTRGARVLLRNRLKVGVYDASGKRLSSPNRSAAAQSDTHAMNEVIIHRGKDPHLAVVEVYVGGRFLTEAVGDGMIVSTPTGSTAYSLSSGGSIVHPLVPSILLTPICPRSLSFRPLIFSANTPITLRLSKKNRARELEVSIDGVRRSSGIGVGMEVRVTGEDVRGEGGKWRGGVPCLLRYSASGEANGDEGWVGGLNGLLKFNYPFGEE